MKVLEAGRELDALVAEKVMGWTRVSVEPRAWADMDNCWRSDYMGTHGGTRAVVPRYSTEIAAAWEVVEKLAVNAPDADDEGAFMVLRVNDDFGLVACCFERSADLSFEGRAIAPTAPLAICLAALEALEATAEATP